MPALTTYKAIDGGDVQEVSPDPVDDGGLALNTNFRAIADSLPRNNYGASTNPTPDNDSVDTAGIGVDFSPGSRWYNGTAIFECVNAAPTAAVWVQLNGGGGWSGNATSALDMNGYALNMNTGGGSGGGTLNLDGGKVVGGSGSTLQDNGSSVWKIITDGTTDTYISSNTGGLYLTSGGFLAPSGWEYTRYPNTTVQINDAYWGNSATWGDFTLNMINADMSNVNPLFVRGDGQFGIGGNGLPDFSGFLLTGISGALNCNGNTFNLNDGSGSGGGNLNLDQSNIVFGTGATVADNGYGGIGFGLSTTAVQLNGVTVDMNDGAGSGGGNLNMDGGTIVQLRADNQSSAPSSPNLGQIYYDTTTNHLYVWNGTAWKQLDN